MDLAGVVRGTTLCGIKPNPKYGIHWTDDTKKVRGCHHCLAFARGVAVGAVVAPYGIKNNGMPE